MEREDLVKAAEDLNIVFGVDVDTPIDISANSEDLKKLVKEGALWLLPTDELLEETITTLKNLDWKKEDFEGLAETQDPNPAFNKFGIIKYNETEAEVKKTRKKPKKISIPNEKTAKEYTSPPPKRPKVSEPSAYGTAITVLGLDPTMPLHDLYVVMKKRGFDLQIVGNSIKTAHSIFKKIYFLLETNGYLKEEKNGKK